MFYIECIDCQEKYSPEEIIYFCPKCNGLLEVKYDYDEVKDKLADLSLWKTRPISVWKYREVLPIQDDSKIVTLDEGNTRLHKCSRLNGLLGIKNLYIKNEGENPTGSFKDRGMTIGITKSLEYKVDTVVCASTGNTSASLAAYAAKAGTRCVVIIPSGKIAHGKLAQAIVYGALIVQLRGNFDDALKIILKLSLENEKIYLLNSVNPYRLEGQKTLAFETVEQMGGNVPDRVVVPVGNAGNISSIWKGYRELSILGLTDKLPKMVGVQAEGSAPIAKAVKEGKEIIVPVSTPETIASAIRIGFPVNWKKAIRAVYQSKGTAEIVTDHEILEAQSLLARSEGIFIEPASASSIAGLRRLLHAGIIQSDETVVCVATGNGLKDPDAPIKFSAKAIEADVDISSIKRLIGV